MAETRTLLIAALSLASATAAAVPRGGRPTTPAPAGGAPVAPVAAGRTFPLFPPVQFEKLGLEDGLPQIHVTSLAQDKRGFLWIGTQAGGLARYDGARMLHFATEVATNTVSSQFITTIQADPAGPIWVGTGDAGLNMYDPDTNQFTRYRRDSTNPSSIGFDAVTALALDPDGVVWVGLGSGGVDMFDPAKKSFKHVVNSEFSNGGISAISSNGKGQLWIASNGGGVMAVTSARTAPVAAWLPFNSTISRNATSLLVDGDQTLWIGTDDGLYKLPKGAATPTPYTPRPGDRSSISSEKITTLFEDRDRNLWIGTQSGLNHLDAKRTKLTRYAPDAEYPLRTSTYLQYVTTAFQDSSGILWFGTLDFGLYKLHKLRRAFQNYVGTAEFGIPMAFCDGRDGIVWAGTYSHGLYAFDFARNVYTAYPSLGVGKERVLLTTWLTSIHCGRDGTIWLGGSGLGLVKFQPATETYEQFLPDPEGVKGPSSDRIEQILEGADGALWLATWGGGLDRFDPKTNAFKVVSNERLIPSAYLHRILFDVDNPNVLWVGAAQGGIARFDIKANTSKIYRGPRSERTESPVLSNDSVLSLHQEKNGTLWVGTDGGGLDRFDPRSGSAKAFQQKEGLVSSVIYGILPDDANQLWLTTIKGLIRFDITSNKSVTFTSADGLGSTEFNQNAFFRSKTGDFFVSTLGGFNRFNPKEILADTFVRPVVLTKFRLFDEEPALARQIWDTAAIDLSHRDSVFTVEFAAPAFAAPKQTRYAYMLEGFRDEWQTTERGELTFTNLDAGDYVLKVKASSRHGTWNETPTLLEIHVEPPIWRTKPAYALYVLVLIGAGLLVVYLQRERLRRVEREGRLALVEHDLELTGAVQSGFLPDHNEITSNKLQIVGFYRAADMCSGDWWWHEHLDGARHLVIVGDVTGHGPGPAMVTAAVATAFHVLASTNRQIDVSTMLELINREVLRVAKGKYQMTMAALEIDETTGEWTLHSAGAPPILTLDQKGKHKVHFCPGSFLGADTIEVGQLKGTLLPTERILLYTDGIPEITMADGNVLGIRRFAQQYERTRGQPCSTAVASIVSYAEEVGKGERRQADDWTFALVEWGHGRGT